MIAIGAAITTVTLENTTASAQANVPVTFGQAFKAGDLPATGAAVELRAPDNSIIPCQLDVRREHPDGSVRHAVLSAIIPALGASASGTYSIVRKAADSAPTPAVPGDFAGLEAVVTWTEGGTVYSASLASLLAGTKTTWLAGDVVSEWEVAGPLKTAENVEHAHLHVRFVARAYKGQAKARIDITVENTWAWNLSPQDVTGDVAMTVSGVAVYSKAALVHHPRTRYRKLCWWNAAEPAVHIAHDIGYLIATRAIPNYDRTATPDAATAIIFKNNTVTNGEPMGYGTARSQMGSPGGRSDMGILPGWAALYLIGMHKDAKTATLNQGNLAGSWSMHCRDKNTGRVLSFNDWPYYAFSGTAGDNINPSTGLSEKAPATVTNTNPNISDVSHHPDQAYVPYLVTGDIYYLEELQFWAQACAISQNGHANYRAGNKGLVHRDQTRGQAWALRSFAHAAYISPAGTKQAEFEFILKSNIDWYDARYTNSTADDAQLGALIHGEGIVYQSTAGDLNGIANWQDDHFTSAVGRSVELGFDFALPLLNWKAKYTVARLYGVPGTCWVQAAAFSMRVRDTTVSPIYTTYAEAYAKSMSPAILAAAADSNCGTQAMADAWLDYNNWRITVTPTRAYMDGVSNPAVGDMDGYSDSTTGYPSNLQPAIAYCAMFNATNAGNAWEVFDGRSVKPNYGTSPQFAIVPRSIVTSDPIPPTPPTGESNMKFIDRVKETTTTTGTGAFALGGAVTADACRAFSPSYTVGDRVPYCARLGTEWEVGHGTLTASTTLARTTVTSSSNNGQLVNFSAGTKEVWANVSAAALAEFLTEASLAALGQPIPTYLAMNPGGALSAADVMLMVQGNAVVSETMDALTTFVLNKYPTAKAPTLVVSTTTPFPLDFSTHHRRRIVCTAATTINAPGVFSSVGNDFECEVVNISGGVVTFGAGISCLPAGSTIPNGRRATVFASGGAIYALMPAADAATVAPGQVTGLATSAPTSSGMTLNWTAPTTGTAPFGYTVQSRVTSVGGAWTTLATGVSATTYVTTGQAASTGFDYQVAATNAGGTGAYSTTATGTTSAAALAAPGQVTGLTVGTTTSTTAPLSWTAPATGGAVATYTVNYRVVGAGSWTAASTSVTGTTYTVTGLTAGTAYEYQVIAVNATGPGTASATVSGSTPTAAGDGGVAPFTLTATAAFPTVIACGVANYLWHNIVPTGAATIVSTTAGVSSSATVPPTSSLAEGTTPKGRWLGAAWKKYGTGTDYIYEVGPVIGYTLTSAEDYYLWISITDSNGATWWFRRTAPISVGPGGTTLATVGSASNTPQAQV